MIAIDVERCTGCGACVELCPTGALYLVEGKAMVDRALCRECEACVDACPVEAILLVEQEEPAGEVARVPALRPEPAVIRVKTEPPPVLFRAKVLPAVGAALAWAGREILPPIAEFFLDTLDRRTTQPQARSDETRAPSARGGGRQHRHRRRGGGQ